MVRTIFEDEHIRVVHRLGSNAYTLVTFSVLGFKGPGNIFWGKRLCDAHGINALGVVAKAPNWFPASSMRQARETMRPFLKPPVVTFGLSHGGYGALKYASLLGAASVVSICPQYSINPSALSIAPVYAAYFDHTLHDGMEITRADQSGRVLLAYDPYYRRDAKHITHILAQGYPDTVPVPMRYLSHRLGEILVDDALGTTLIEASLDSGALAALQPRLRRMRRQSTVFHLNLAEHMLQRGKRASARRLLESDALQRTGLDMERLAALLARARAPETPQDTAGAKLAPQDQEAREVAWELGKSGLHPALPT